ncbi:MAG: LysM domain-containing protein [Planctomycetota bacterium]
MSLLISSLFAVAALFPNHPAPDLIPGGMKVIQVDARVELGPFADRVVTAYVVREGDTLEAIAKQFLGTASRWNDIAALSPDVEPKKLRIGQVLLLPPRQAPVEGQELLFAYYDPAQSVRWSAVPFPADGVLPAAPRRGHLRIYLVAGSARQDFANFMVGRDSKELRKHIDELSQAGKLTLLDAMTPNRVLRKDDPIVRRSEVYRIAQEKDAAPTLSLASSESFDKDGNAVKKDAGAEEKKRDGLLLLLFAGIGGAGLLVLANRRRELAQRTSCALA